MSIDQERLNAFQARMNGWVSSQGLFFQLRHGGAVYGASSSFMAGLFRLVLRVVVLLLVALLCFWIYLAKRVGTGGFEDDLGEGITRVLGAEDVEIGGIDRQRGFLNLNQLSIEGGGKSFFYAAEVRGVRTPMGLLDGVLGPWEIEDLSVKELRVKVKSGAETDEAAAEAFGAVFKLLRGFRFSRLHVERATVFWGYSRLHRGGIRDAKMVVEREGEGWSVVFTGGEFSQNWMKNFEIERLVMKVMPDGVTIPEIKLRLEGGRVHGQVEFVAGGARPELKGAGTMTGVPVFGLLKPEYRDFIQGRFSGTFEIDGSMNSQDGIGMTVDVELEQGDVIELRDRFLLFKAVSTADLFRSYNRVKLTRGRFQMRTGGGEMHLDEIRLEAPDLMRLEGALHARPPTDDEIKTMLDLGDGPTVGGLPLSLQEESGDGRDEFSLKNAAEVDKKDPMLKVPGSIILSSEFGVGPTQDLEEDEVRRQQQSQQLIGEVRVGLTKDTFARSPSLEAHYPAGEEGLRWIKVPIKGNIYTVGETEAKLLYEQQREGR